MVNNLIFISITYRILFYNVVFWYNYGKTISTLDIQPFRCWVPFDTRYFRPLFFWRWILSDIVSYWTLGISTFSPSTFSLSTFSHSTFSLDVQSFDVQIMNQLSRFFKGQCHKYLNCDQCMSKGWNCPASN